MCGLKSSKGPRSKVRRNAVQEGHLELVEPVLRQLGGLESRVEEPAGCERLLLPLRLVVPGAAISRASAPPRLLLLAARGLQGPERRTGGLGPCCWVEPWTKAEKPGATGPVKSSIDRTASSSSFFFAFL